MTAELSLFSGSFNRTRDFIDELPKFDDKLHNCEARAIRKGSCVNSVRSVSDFWICMENFSQIFLGVRDFPAVPHRSRWTFFQGGMRSRHAEAFHGSQSGESSSPGKLRNVYTQFSDEMKNSRQNETSRFAPDEEKKNEKLHAVAISER